MELDLYDEYLDDDEEKSYGLDILQETADALYLEAGEEVDEPQDQITMFGHEYLLQDKMHLLIMEVLSDTQIPFSLAPFQMRSLHVLGNRKNLILISPTGSGKMLGKI